MKRNRLFVRLAMVFATTLLSVSTFATDFSLSYADERRTRHIDAELTRVAFESNVDVNRVMIGLETDFPAAYDLVVDQDADGRMLLRISDVDGEYRHEVLIDRRELTVSYYEREALHQTKWVFGPEDVVDFLRRSDAKLADGEIAYPFNLYPLHRLALKALDTVEITYGDDGIDHELFRTATAVLVDMYVERAPEAPRSEWESWQIQKSPDLNLSVHYRDFPLHAELANPEASAPLVSAPVGRANQSELAIARPIDVEPCIVELDHDELVTGMRRDDLEISNDDCGCTAPRSANPASTTGNLTFAGVTGTMSVASVSLSALCHPGHGLASNATGGLITGSYGGGAACPNPGWFEEIVQVDMDYSATANVSPNTDCCRNGGGDTATTASLTISGFGGSANFTGPSDSGDWLSGYATVSMVGTLCYEDDVWFDDFISATFSGTATAGGS